MKKTSWLRRAASWFTPESKSKSGYDLVTLHQQGKAIWTPRNYRELAEEAYQKNAIAFRCVRMIAEAAASVPLDVWEKNEKLVDHPMVELMTGPNAFECGRQWFERLYGFLQISGNGFIEATIVGGQIREMHALRPDRMKVIVNDNGWPEGYELNVNGTTVSYRRDAVTGIIPILHITQFHPTNDHYGFSPVEAAASAIDIHNAASEWNKALLDNGARPSGALVYKGIDGAQNLTPDQVRRLKIELEESFQGEANAGRPMLLEGGLDWKPLSLSPADLDFINAKHNAAREIALAFGVPPMLLGIPGDNTYSNYREANLSFWRQSVIPVVEKTCQSLSRWLAPVYSDVRVVPHLDDIPQLSLERERRWKRIDEASFLSESEKREMLGLAPREG